MSSRPERVFIFDMMRNRSHLFFRYLSTHPDVYPLWHPFVFAANFGPESIWKFDQNVDLDDKTSEHSSSDAWIETYEDANRKLEKGIKEAEHSGKLLVANEHVQHVLNKDVSFSIIRQQDVDIALQSNPTMISDQIFKSFTPIFVIREPVFAVPSNYIACLATGPGPGTEAWTLITNPLTQRRLFDYFRKRDGRIPLVVDGDDIVWRTQEVSDKLCQALAITPRALSTTWEAVPEEKRHESPLIRHFLQTIDDSTGIQVPPDQRPDTDLNKAYSRWKKEHGEDIANELKKTVETSRPHYEYMAQFKL